MKKLKFLVVLLGTLVLSIVLPLLATATETSTEAPTEPVTEAPEPSLSAKRITIYKGEKKKVRVNNLAAGNPVTWTSSKPSVAKVSKSKSRFKVIKGVGVGKARVTAKFGNTKLTCRVTVKNPVIKLNKRRLSVDPGSTAHLKIKELDGPSEDVTWKSSNRKIAIVSTNGTVTGKAAGQCVISATANGVTATCTVTVNAPASMYLDQTEVYLQTGGKDELEATIAGKVSQASYVWSSSNKSVATVSASENTCVVTAKGPGTSTISVKYGDLKASCKVTVTDSYEVVTAEIDRVVTGGVETDYAVGVDANGYQHWKVQIAQGAASEAYLATVATFQSHVYAVTTTGIQVLNLENGQPDGRYIQLDIGGTPLALVDDDGYVYAFSSYMGANHIVYKVSPYVSGNKMALIWSCWLYSNFLEPCDPYFSPGYDYLYIYDAGPYYQRVRISTLYGETRYYSK